MCGQYWKTTWQKFETQIVKEGFILGKIYAKCASDFYLHIIIYHSSEIRCLCWMKWPGETLQNLPYCIYIYEKQKLLFQFFISRYFIFPLALMNALVYVEAQNEKREKQLWVFVYTYKIWQILKRFVGLFHPA